MTRFIHALGFRRRAHRRMGGRLRCALCNTLIQEVPHDRDRWSTH